MRATAAVTLVQERPRLAGWLGCHGLGNRNWGVHGVAKASPLGDLEAGVEELPRIRLIAVHDGQEPGARVGARGQMNVLFSTLPCFKADTLVMPTRVDPS